MMALSLNMTTDITLCEQIDADLPENQHPKQELDETEFIEVLRVPMHHLLAHLTDLATRRQCIIDAKLYTLALGLSFTEQQ